MRSSIRPTMAALLVALAAVLVPALARGQAESAPPLEARLFFKEPLPAGLVFPPGAPITMILQVENTSGAPVHTTSGFGSSDMFRRLFFVEPAGGIVTNLSEGNIARESRPVAFCQTRGGIIQRPAAIPVQPSETLPASFVREFEFDARTLYDLARPGRYTVDARIPLLAFQVGDPAGLITDCDEFPGVSLVNIGAGTPAQQFLVRSNALEFTLGAPPGGGDTVPPELSVACAPPASSPSVVGLDPGGGIGSIVRTPGKGQEIVTVLDLTGNRLEATLAVNLHDRLVEFGVQRLVYGTSEAPVASNRVKCKWTQDRRSGALSYLSQEVTIRAGARLVEALAIYDARADQTRITARRSDGRGYERVVRPGVVLLRVITRQGEVELEF